MRAEVAASVQANEDIGCCYRSVNRPGLRIVWEITSACHLSCRHCFRTVNTPPDLSTHEAVRVITEMRDLDVRKVGLTGGEPFLRRDLLDLVALIQSHDMLVKVVTSLTALPARAVDRLARLGGLEVAFSVDGASADSHDYLRGEGRFAQLMRNLALVSGMENIQLNGICVLSKHNCSEIPQVVELAARHSLRSITFSALFPIDSPAVLVPRDFYATHTLSAEEVDAALATIVGLRGRFPNLAIRSVGFVDESPCCPAGGDQLHIDPGGNVNPCTLYRFGPAPNLRGCSLQDCLARIRAELFSAGTSYCRYLHLSAAPGKGHRGNRPTAECSP